MVQNTNRKLSQRQSRVGELVLTKLENYYSE